MGNETVAEDPVGEGVPQTVSVSNWATSLDAGTVGTTGITAPGDESGQVLTFTLAPSSGDFSDLFSQDPDIDSSGNLTYTLKPHAYGQIEVDVSLSDGITTVTEDASADQKTSFTITVLMVNDAPFFDQGGNQHVADNAGPQQVSNWATNIRPGPTGSEAAYDEEGGAYGQTLSFVLSYQAITDADDSTITWQDLFVAGGEPTIDSSGHLTYTPLPGGKGTAVISVVLQDDGETETSAGTTISDPKQDPAAGAAPKKR